MKMRDCMALAMPMLALALSLSPLRAETIRSDVSVLDGDTIVMNFNKRHVRLDGIDAPERKQTCQAIEADANPQWKCGEAAREALLQLVRPQKADWIVTCQGEKSDKYGRLIGVCYLPEPIVGMEQTNCRLDVGCLMVWLGWAVAYRRYSLAYVPQENAARAAKRGIWNSNFVYPEQFRHPTPTPR